MHALEKRYNQNKTQLRYNFGSIYFPVRAKLFSSKLLRKVTRYYGKYSELAPSICLPCELFVLGTNYFQGQKPLNIVWYIHETSKISLSKYN